MFTCTHLGHYEGKHLGWFWGRKMKGRAELSLHLPLLHLKLQLCQTAFHSLFKKKTIGALLQVFACNMWFVPDTGFLVAKDGDGDISSEKGVLCSPVTSQKGSLHFSGSEIFSFLHTLSSFVWNNSMWEWKPLPQGMLIFKYSFCGSKLQFSFSFNFYHSFPNEIIRVYGYFFQRPEDKLMALSNKHLCSFPVPLWSALQFNCAAFWSTWKTCLKKYGNAFLKTAHVYCKWQWFYHTPSGLWNDLTWTNSVLLMFPKQPPLHLLLAVLYQK